MSDCTLLSTSLSGSEKKSLLDNLTKHRFVQDGFVGKLLFNINQGGITSFDKIDSMLCEYPARLSGGQQGITSFDKIDSMLSLDSGMKKLIMDEFKKSKLIHGGFTGKLLLDIDRGGAIEFERTDKIR